MKLVKHTTSDFGTTDLFGNPQRSHHWGRKHYFLIENATAAELEAIEELMEMAGWETDGCPCYEDGFTSGFHIEIESVSDFKSAYKQAKKALPYYMEQKEVEAERAAEPANRQAAFFAKPDHQRAYDIECAHAEALQMDCEFEASPLRRLLNASDSLNPASDALIAALENAPFVATIFKHLTSDHVFAVTPSRAYMVVGDGDKARPFHQVSAQDIVNNPECFELVDTCRNLTRLDSPIDECDFLLEGDSMADFLERMYTLPACDESEEVPEEIQKLHERLEALYEDFNHPNLRVEGDKLIGFWMESGEEKTVVLYQGDETARAQDIAQQRNADEERYWRDQQRGEQAAEARNERWFEEGNGLGAFEYEDRLRAEGRF